MGLIKKIKSYIRLILQKHLYTATLVEGVLSETSTPFRCLFVGGNQYRDYLTQKMYRDSATILWQQNIFSIYGVQRLISQSPAVCDLLVAVLPESKEHFLKNKYSYKSYESIGHLIDVSNPWDVIRNSFGKNARRTERQIQEYGLSYRISNELEDFDYFYDRIYVPYLKMQFGMLAILHSRDEVKKYFDRGFLMFVIRNGVRIAGRLAYRDGSKLVCQFFGLLDGNKLYARIGAQRALYYFTIQYCKLIGIETIDPLSSRAFLNEAVYRHKREWNSHVLKSADLEYAVYFFNVGGLSKTCCFYEKNPLIISTDDGLGFLVGKQEIDSTDVENIKNKLIEKYFAPGLSVAYLITEQTNVPQIFSLIP